MDAALLLALQQFLQGRAQRAAVAGQRAVGDASAFIDDERGVGQRAVAPMNLAAEFVDENGEVDLLLIAQQHGGAGFVFHRVMRRELGAGMSLAHVDEEELDLGDGELAGERAQAADGGRRLRAGGRAEGETTLREFLKSESLTISPVSERSSKPGASSPGSGARLQRSAGCSAASRGESGRSCSGRIRT